VKKVIGSINSGNVTGYLCPSCKNAHVSGLAHEGNNSVYCFKCGYRFSVDKNKKLENISEIKKVKAAFKTFGFQLQYGKENTMKIPKFWFIPKGSILTWVPEKYVRYEVTWARYESGSTPCEFAIYRKVSRGKKSCYPKEVMSGYLGEMNFVLGVQADKDSVNKKRLPACCLHTDMYEIVETIKIDYEDNVLDKRIKRDV